MGAEALIRSIMAAMEPGESLVIEANQYGWVIHLPGLQLIWDVDRSWQVIDYRAPYGDRMPEEQTEVVHAWPSAS